jgi:hypothetical protein
MDLLLAHGSFIGLFSFGDITHARTEKAGITASLIDVFSQ